MISLQYLVLVGRVTFFSMLAAKLGWAKSCLVGVCYYMGGIFLPYQRMSCIVDLVPRLGYPGIVL
jgi:hypothetical protein